MVNTRLFQFSNTNNLYIITLSPSHKQRRLRRRLKSIAFLLHSQAMEVGILKFTWKIKNFSKLQNQKLYSDVFSLGSYKWRILAYPKGYSAVDQDFSIFLEVADLETLPSGWSRNAKFSFTLINQLNKKLSFTRDTYYEFDTDDDNWGFASFISHKQLHDPKNGYLVEDMCMIKTNVTIYADASIESHGTSKETNKVDDLENAIEDDMNVFFGDLQTVISVDIVPSCKEARQALEIIDHALNMVPVDLNNPDRMSQLTTAFDVLSSLASCPKLDSEQTEEFFSMKNNFIPLLEKAAQAIKDTKLFTEKELVRKTLDRKLGRCLAEFEKAKAETMHNKQHIGVLQERVDSLLDQIFETEKKKEVSLLKQKEMYKLSKELKDELDVLVKNWPGYEAKMRAAEAMQKVVGKEWSKMKLLVSSLIMDVLVMSCVP